MKLDSIHILIFFLFFLHFMFLGGRTRFSTGFVSATACLYNPGRQPPQSRPLWFLSSLIAVEATGGRDSLRHVRSHTSPCPAVAPCPTTPRIPRLQPRPRPFPQRRLSRLRSTWLVWVVVAENSNVHVTYQHVFAAQGSRSSVSTQSLVGSL